MAKAQEDTNRHVDCQKWYFIDKHSEWLSEDDGLDKKHCSLDYFLKSIPPDVMQNIIKFTSKNLSMKDGNNVEMG
jgi:hypothetical protein